MTWGGVAGRTGEVMSSGDVETQMHEETDKKEYERPTLTRHGEFGQVTAGRTGKWEDGSGGRRGL